MFTCHVFKDSTSVFDVCFLYQSRQQGLVNRYSCHLLWNVALVIFFIFFCTVFSQKEKGDVVFSRYRLNNVWQKWHLRVRTASCQWFLLYLYYLSYKRKHHEPVTGNKLYEKSQRRERIVRNRKDAHDKNTGIALKYSHKVNEIVSSEDWRVGLFMFYFFFLLKLIEINQDCNYKWIKTNILITFRLSLVYYVILWKKKKTLKCFV